MGQLIVKESAKKFIGSNRLKGLDTGIYSVEKIEDLRSLDTTAIKTAFVKDSLNGGVFYFDTEWKRLENNTALSIKELIKNSEFKNNTACFNGFNSNAPIISSVTGLPNGTGTQLVANAENRKRIINAIGSGGGNNIITYTCQNPHGLKTGDRVVLKGFDFESLNTGGSNNGGNPTGQEQFKATKITVVDDFNFSYSLGGNQTANGVADTSLNAWWEYPPTFFKANDSVFNWVLPNKEAISEKGALTTYYLLNSGVSSELPQSKFSAFEFYLNDDEFEIFTVRGRFHVYADGVRVTNNYIEVDQPSYPGYLTKISFADTKTRLIRIELLQYPATVWGVATKNKNGISSSKNSFVRKPMGILCGDSFGEGTGTKGFWVNSFGYLLGKNIGIEMVHGSLGSTGLTTNGVHGVGSKYLDRMKELKQKNINCDYVFVMDSVNDADNTTFQHCEDFISGVYGLWPGVKIIVLGRLQPNTAQPSLISSIAWLEACRKYKIPYIDGGIGVRGKVWINEQNKETYYNGTKATATANIVSNGLDSITLSNPGSGYDFIDDNLGFSPVVSVTGGGGSGAEAIANMNFKVTAVEVLNGGKNYTYANLTISSGAEAECILNGSAVFGCRVLKKGGVFNAVPSVTLIGGGGSGATAEAIIEDGDLKAINITNGGSGYTSNPTVEISISDEEATAKANIINGVIDSVNITSKGNFYIDNPICLVDGDGYGANIMPYLSGVVDSVTVTNAGSGYTSTPVIDIQHPTNFDVTHPKSMGHRMIADRYFNNIVNYGV